MVRNRENYTQWMIKTSRSARYQGKTEEEEMSINVTFKNTIIWLRILGTKEKRSQTTGIICMKFLRGKQLLQKR